MCESTVPVEVTGTDVPPDDAVAPGSMKLLPHSMLICAPPSKVIVGAPFAVPSTITVLVAVAVWFVVSDDV